MKESPTIFEEWESVETPLPPELKRPTINPKETALLILDIQNQNCNQERRPRCVRSLPKISSLLSKARHHQIPVVFSLIRSSYKQDIRTEVSPRENERIVKSGVDKFFETNLEGIMKENNVQKIIIAGTSAHGAVLHTATGAVQRKYEVIVPIDVISSTEPYAEQYAVWHLANAPGTRGRVILTKSDWIKISSNS